MASLKLGTRGSALALWQANWTKAQLEERWPGLVVELVPIKTTGDKVLDVPLAKIGGKGLFTKEIDEALLSGRIDFAVHSMKDVPFQLPNGIDFAAVPIREDSRDAFLSKGMQIQDLPAGSRVGTSSLRRQVQLRHRFPSLRIINLRGNVDTRLRKLASGDFDAVILAAAGLNRLGYSREITQILDEDMMLSAVGQGALGIVCRSSDTATSDTLRVLDDPVTHGSYPSRVRANENFQPIHEVCENKVALDRQSQKRAELSSSRIAATVRTLRIARQPDREPLRLRRICLVLRRV